MPTPQFPAVSDNASLGELTDAYVAISRYLTYLLSALDTLNISRLDAKVVVTGTLDAGKVTIRVDYDTGAYILLDSSGMTIFDGTEDTFHVDIEGNITMIGTLNASVINGSEINGTEINGSTMNASVVNGTEINGGTITGPLIQTSASSYPRAEMRSSDQIFMAAADSSNTMEFIASAAGTPALVASDGTINRGSFSYSNDFTGTKRTKISGSNGMEIQTSGGDINFVTGLYKTSFLDWNSVLNRFSSQTLQQALDLKKNVGGGFTGAIPPGSTIFVTDGEITGYM